MKKLPLLGSLALLALAAQAQETAAPPAETTEAAPTIPVPEIAAPAQPDLNVTEESAPTVLDEVVVTATKRATPVRRIPATIAVLSGEDLEREGVQSIDQIVQLVPGVNLSDDGQGQAKRITIRGVSADMNVNFTAGTLFGDIPFTDPFVPKVQLDPNPFDMATVEVLKGPQGTLFGGSGLNGMIRYVPEPPQFNETSLKYYAQYQSYPGNGDSGWNYGAALNMPIAEDAAALRLVGFHRDAPGYIDDIQKNVPDVNSLTQYGFRGMFAWYPLDGWKLSLMGVTQHTFQDDVAFTNNDQGELTRSNTPRPSTVETDYSLANLGLEHSFGWADFISQTSGFEKRNRIFIDSSRIVPGGLVPVLGLPSFSESQAFIQELRLVSPADNDSPWKWLGGAFFYQMDLFDCTEGGLDGTGSVGLPTGIDFSELLALLGDRVLATPCAQNKARLDGKLNIIHLEGDLKLSEHALFGEVTRRLGDEWEATLGARLYRTESSGTITNSGLLYVVQNMGQSGARDATVEEQGISPKASIAYIPSDSLRVYLTAARGFRFGGIQLGRSTLTTQIPEVFKSDSLWSYELGLRTDWLDRTLTLDASAYYIDWTDPQVNQSSADSLVTFIDNVGGVEGRGVDFSLRYLLPFLEGLSVSGSAAWNRTVTTAAFRSATGVNVPEGSPWPLSPEWQTSATLAYAVPLESWRSSIALRHSYSGKACNTIECTAQVFGYRTLDLNLSLASLEHTYWPEVSLSLSNLTDERGLSNVTNSATLGDSYSYIPPRALVLRIGGRL